MVCKAGHYLRLHQLGDELHSMAENVLDDDIGLAKKFYKMSIALKEFSIERAIVEKIPKHELEMYQRDLRIIKAKVNYEE